MKQAFKDGDGLNFHGDRKPRPVVEPPPWKKPILQKGGKALGVLKEMGIFDVRPEWGPPFEAWKISPLTDRPVMLLKYSEKDGYLIEIANVKVFKPEATDEDMRQRLTR